MYVFFTNEQYRDQENKLMLFFRSFRVHFYVLCIIDKSNNLQSMIFFVKDSINSDFFYFKSKTENVTAICKLDFCKPLDLKRLFTLCTA